MRYIVILGVALGSISSATAAIIEPPATPVTAPSGKPGWSLKCSGWGRTMEDCYEKAGKLCPHGYNIENQNQSVQGIPQGNGSTVIISKDYMLISCKDAPAPTPPPEEPKPPTN